jgi:hypothetical protein
MGWGGSGFAVFAPADPDGSVLQSFYSNAAGFFNFLKDLVPGLRAFILTSGYDDGLRLLNGRRGDEALDSPPHKFVGILWLQFDGCDLLHIALLVLAVCIYSIDPDVFWQERGWRLAFILDLAQKSPHLAGFVIAGCLGDWLDQK